MIDCWTTPDIKPFQTEPILFYAGGGQFPYLGWYYIKTDMFGDWESDDVQKWAYVNEIIAQADKAERLQEQLDIAIDSLKYIRDNDYGDPSGEAVDALTAIHKLNK